MKSPLLSVIIPVYNGSRSIKTIASSITQQSFRDLELILVDDGSTDDTINVLRGIKKNDARVIIKSKKNGGPSSARNLGLSTARGTYIIFLDADDDISSDMFTVFVSALIKNECDLVSSGWRIDLRTGTKMNEGYKLISPKPESITGNALTMKKYFIDSIGNNGQLYNLWNKVFKRSIIEDHNIYFREDVQFGEDLIFTFHYMKYVKSMTIIPDVLYYYQANSQTSTFSKSALDPTYRLENITELDVYIGNSPDEELYQLAMWVKYRWTLSFYLLVAGSAMSRYEKIKLIAQAPTDGLSPKKSVNYIGFKKYCIELLLSVCTKSPYAALFIGTIGSTLKKQIIKFRAS